MVDLIKTIKIMREKIETHEDDLSNNEMMTRYTLVDPLLRALDWDTSDPNDVAPESPASSRSKTDYTMGAGVMLIEAMRLNGRLEEWAPKLIQHIRDREARYGVITDGQRWQLYDSQTAMSGPAVEFDITDSEGAVLSRVIRLHRSVVLDSFRSKSPDTEDDTEDADSAEESSMKKSNELISLTALKHRYTEGMPRPTELVCPDRNIPLSWWVDIPVGMADWLISKKYLDRSHCPVTAGPKNSILHTQPVHQNGKLFHLYEKVHDIYVNKSGNPHTIIRHTIKLITAAGLKPSDFKLNFNRLP